MHTDLGSYLAQVSALVVVMVSPAFSGPLAKDSCTAVTEEVRQRVIDYAKQTLKRPVSMVEQLPDKVVEGSCYVKLQVQPDGSEPVTMYLSPDRQFVFPDVFVLNQDPAIQQRTRRLGLAQELLTGDPPTSGRQDAPISIVIFSDFQCSYCKTEAKLLRQTVDRSIQGKVRLVFRHYPLNVHNSAAKAAEAGMCVSQQNQEAFWEYHDQIFSSQALITVATLPKFLNTFVQNQHLDKVAFDQCLASGRAALLVGADALLGRRNGVMSTPTIFVNGFKREGVQNDEELKSLILESLEGGFLR